MKSICQFLFLINLIISCPHNDERCASCMGKTCLFCYDGYLKSGVCQEPTTRIENCMSYSSATQCQQCVFGYALSNNKCESISIENCLRVNNSNECIACSNGTLVSSGKCTSDVKCSVENCEICGWNGANEICIKCNSGYSIYPREKTNQCSSDGKTSGCLSQNFTDQQQCGMCKPYHFYSEGSCSSTSVQQLNMENSNILSIIYITFGVIYSTLI